jgi:arsenite-transporting ATPase
MQPLLYFFIGKGGVGKSTTAALSALWSALGGRRTLLVSMDPAHNQRDIFESRFGEKPRGLLPHLAVQEIDTEYWMARYLKETREQIKRTYLYESAFNLLDHFKVLQFSPGLEEYALLRAFENVLHRASRHEVIVFDMAPTAITLRFFSLPAITLVWLGELIKLRSLICKKKEIMIKIKDPCRKGQGDRVMEKLHQLVESHTRLRDHLTSSATRIHLVVNNDRLSLAEAVRIAHRLDDMDIRIDRVLANKLAPRASIEEIAGAFDPAKILRLPLSPEVLVGLPALRRFLQVHGETFSNLLQMPVGGPSPLLGR